MNANNQSNNKSKISYKGSILDPGSRSGKNRQNWIKRQKSRVRTSTILSGSISGRSTNQNSKSNTRSQNRSRVNRSVNDGANSQSVRSAGKSISTSTKVSVADLGTYVTAVLDPFYAGPGARVPSSVPFPSCTCTMNFTGLLTPNASGNFALLFNPQAGVLGGWQEYVNIFTDASLTSANAFVQTVTANATGLRTAYLPAGLALKYRVVGAGMKAWFVGKEQDRAGYYVAAFLPKAPVRGAGGAPYTAYTEDQLRESQYSSSCSNKAVPEVVYVPRDDIDYDYMEVATIRESSLCVIQGFGLPNTACIKWEVIIHAEFIPDPTAANSRLLTTGLSFADKDEASAILSHVTNKVPGYVASPETGTSLSWDLQRSVSDLLDESMAMVGSVASNYIGSFAKDALVDFASFLL